MDPKVSLEQMLAAIPPQSQCQKVSGAHLAEISRELTSWKLVCTNLEISEAEEKAIEEENKEVAMRRYDRAFVLFHRTYLICIFYLYRELVSSH